MHKAKILATSAVSLVSALLAGCGGGGGAVASAPTPPPAGTPGPPTPPPPADVRILRQPAGQEFAAFSDGDPLRVRYDAGSGLYEVNFAGSWQPVYRTPTNNDPASMLIGAPNFEGSVGFLGTRTRYDHPDEPARYQYASLLSWNVNRGPEGRTAFGDVTPTAAVPVSGTASYAGELFGTSSAPADAGGWGIIENSPVRGEIALQIDFGAGKLSGELSPMVGCDCVKVPLIPKTRFEGSVLAGSAELQGRFLTDLSGPNSFKGLLAGPAAEEPFGAWAFPFHWDGKLETATGVWIAKK
jgi:hypothetical protein